MLGNLQSPEVAPSGGCSVAYRLVPMMLTADCHERPGEQASTQPSTACLTVTSVLSELQSSMSLCLLEPQGVQLSLALRVVHETFKLRMCLS